MGIGSRTAARHRRKAAMPYGTIGGLFGGAAGYWIGTGGIAGILMAVGVGMVLGSLAGITLGIILRVSSPGTQARWEHSSEGAAEEQTRGGFQLKEERLDITTERVPLNKVQIHREKVTENRTITVPVEREEIVIEKTAMDGSQSVETIRIPVKEEQLEVTKRSVVTADLNIYSREYQTREEISEELKREIAAYEAAGKVGVLEETEMESR